MARGAQAARRAGSACFLGCLLFLSPFSSAGGTLDGRAGMELEYLGESYYGEQFLSAEDLGLPLGASRLVADTTRFHDDSWLPGARLDLTWRTGSEWASPLEIRSSTAGNAERFSQDLDLHMRSADDAGRWRLDAHGGFREESRTLVGHGDWNARLGATREQFLGHGLTATLRGSWERSRLRGDTTSYLYDYDRARMRVGLRPRGWPSSWEGYVEGSVKTVPGAQPGAYREMRAGGSWTPRDDGRSSLDLEVRGRDYERDGEVGRDVVEGDVAGRFRLHESNASSWNLETTLALCDYRGEDELYFDSGELTATVQWEHETGSWTVSVGPAARFLQDLGGKDRGYRQWTGRGSGRRFVGAGGLGEVDLELGFRDYQAEESEVIEISSLSSSLVRSDYWLVDAFASWMQPVGGNMSVDLLASFSWEFHGQGSERIGVGFVTVTLTRKF